MTDQEQPEQWAVEESAALAWLNVRITQAKQRLDKAEYEAKAFQQKADDGEECWQSCANWWRADAERERASLGIYDALLSIAFDRNEWREQHENLLSVRQSDLRAFTERTADLVAREAKMREALEGLLPDFIGGLDPTEPTAVIKARAALKPREACHG